MRLIIIIEVCIVSIVLQCFMPAFGQKHDTTYWKSYSDLSRIIDSAFRKRDDTAIIEQTAIVELQITKGKVETFHVWSIYEKTDVDWLAAFVAPIKGRYFKGYRKFEYVIIPVKVLDTRNQRDRKVEGLDFINTFINAYKNNSTKYLTVTQGILLEPPWPGVK